MACCAPARAGCRGDEEGAPSLLGTPRRMALEGALNTPKVTVMRRRGSSGAGAQGLVCLPGVSGGTRRGVQQGPQESSGWGCDGRGVRGRLESSPRGRWPAGAGRRPEEADWEGWAPASRDREQGALSRASASSGQMPLRSRNTAPSPKAPSQGEPGWTIWPSIRNHAPKQEGGGSSPEQNPELPLGSRAPGGHTGGVWTCPVDRGHPETVAAAVTLRLNRPPPDRSPCLDLIDSLTAASGSYQCAFTVLLLLHERFRWLPVAPRERGPRMPTLSHLAPSLPALSSP